MKDLKGKTLELYLYIDVNYSLLPHDNDLLAEFLVSKGLKANGGFVKAVRSYGRCLRKLRELGYIPETETKQLQQEFIDLSRLEQLTI